MRKRFGLAAVLAVGLAAASADAAVMFQGYGVAPNPGEVMVTDFEGGPTFSDVLFNMMGFSLTGQGELLTGSIGGLSAAPGTSAFTRDTTQYLSIHRNQSATLTTPLLDAISFYVGSLDGFNSFTFHLANGTTEVITGAFLASLPGMDANGSQNGFTSNGRLTFSFDSAITSVDLASATNSLEISDISTIASLVSGAPEPASWAMMLAGFGGVGAVLRGRRRRLSVA